MSRHFNTAGPNRVEKHYTLPALDRLPEVRRLVQEEAWFVLHAPRQTGKTTAMRALAKELTSSGLYTALWATCEAAEAFRRDPAAAERIVVDAILQEARFALPAELCPDPPDPAAVPGNILASFLGAWCRLSPRPVVLLLDEIDALQDESLVSVLRQLRSIYPRRPEGAPSTIALIGLRDVRDYKVAAGGTPQLGTSSPFNVKVASLKLGNFDADDVAALYAQHTAESGQAFTAEAVARVVALTGGQPWLVNALAYQVTRVMGVTETITVEHIDRAKERLILSRATHLDSLADKLREARVRSVVGPILSGGELPLDVDPRDIEYCADLGLLAYDGRTVRIANPIYREILPRELAYPVQVRLSPPDRRWSLPDGRLDLTAILDAFVDFWRQHGEWMVRGQSWPEAAHQIVLMAFLQRLVNGGGIIEREYGLGRKRLDLLIRWFIGVDAQGPPTGEDRHAIEMKVWREGERDPLPSGLEQIDGYLGRLLLSTGTLMLFDARSASPTGEAWETRGTPSTETTPSGRVVTVWRL